MRRDLPSGTVTFLFTDIEGSTRLLEALGERYGEAVEEQRRLLRRAFADAGGVEVDTQGDAFFVVFQAARDAVRAAAEAQRSLASHEWPEGLPVRVRLHRAKRRFRAAFDARTPATDTAVPRPVSPRPKGWSHDPEAH